MKNLPMELVVSWFFQIRFVVDDVLMKTSFNYTLHSHNRHNQQIADSLIIAKHLNSRV
ncbi:MAG: hypothetical protein LBH74_07175 [Nitrososphaerota archaeon]|nr:hypothetical protein [Nitrososphaerota archaeon]